VLEGIFVLQERVLSFTLTHNCVNNPVVASFILSRISTFLSTSR